MTVNVDRAELESEILRQRPDAPLSAPEERMIVWSAAQTLLERRRFCNLSIPNYTMRAVSAFRSRLGHDRHRLDALRARHQVLSSPEDEMVAVYHIHRESDVHGHAYIVLMEPIETSASALREPDLVGAGAK